MPAAASLSERHITRIATKYDFRDAEDRVSMLREWVEGEPDADEYEFPDVEGCIHPCLRRPALNQRRLRSLRAQAANTRVGSLIDAVLDLERISRQAKRPELSDEMREELCDTNPPLPSLLAVFAEGDAVEGCFDEDGQTMMEVTPEPSVILPFNAYDPQGVSQVFRTFGVICDTLAAASRVIDLMPANDQWVIER